MQNNILVFILFILIALVNFYLFISQRRTEKIKITDFSDSGGDFEKQQAFRIKEIKIKQYSSQQKIAAFVLILSILMSIYLGYLLMIKIIESQVDMKLTKTALMLIGGGASTYSSWKFYNISSRRLDQLQ